MTFLPAQNRCADAPCNTRCPRCGKAFRCGAGDARPCACSGVAVDPTLAATLRERYTGCLCLGCLSALAVDPGAIDSAPAGRR